MSLLSTFPGLYALASLDGSTLAERDADALGFARPEEHRFFIRIREDDVDSESRHIPDTDYVFLGHIDERQALADTLRLDPATPSAMLVRAALARFGDDAPSRILGEWSFVQWDEVRGALTLMVADTLRDALLFATDGRRVAVAPHIRILRRLDGIDAVPDTCNLVRYMGHAPVRDAIGDRTMLRGVRRVQAGTRVTITRHGVTTSVRRSLPDPTPWQGSFAEAMEESDRLLRRILAAQMVRYPASAVMLSGGLDSSIVAVFAAAERVGRGPIALTSAAPIGSGLLDETEFSSAVAAQAEIAMLPVVPPADADAYRPSRALSHWLQQPIVSPRHYVYDALYRTAAAERCHAILDGGDGEWTVSGYPDGLGLRQRLRDTLTRITTLPTRRSTQDAFAMQLSAPALAIAERDLGAALHRSEPMLTHRRHDLWGYSPEITQVLAQTTTTQHPGLRRLMPLRDRRLLALFASFPYRFITHGGTIRAPARALLAGKVPDDVRLRRHGRPFSPDYMIRIRQQALMARRHLMDYRRAGIDQWLDLRWLDGSLQRIAERPNKPLEFIFRVQMTSTVAGFLLHWLSGEDEPDDDEQ